MYFCFNFFLLSTKYEPLDCLLDQELYPYQRFRRTCSNLHESKFINVSHQITIFSLTKTSVFHLTIGSHVSTFDYPTKLNLSVSADQIISTTVLGGIWRVEKCFHITFTDSNVRFHQIKIGATASLALPRTGLFKYDQGDLEKLRVLFA